MRAAFWVGCAALLLSACSSEPVQQATAAHVAPGLKASMSSSGEANCAMIGGSLSVARQLDVRRLGCVHYPTANAVANSHLPRELWQLLIH
ncbi:protein [Escherichia coli]|uniref:Protein n=1 Tax=Escherichia coli TaxID=562 RepID=A0A376ZXB8_ECOLX|nr:protein [Escherichia coli]